MPTPFRAPLSSPPLAHYHRGRRTLPQPPSPPHPQAALDEAGPLLTPDPSASWPPPPLQEELKPSSWLTPGIGGLAALTIALVFLGRRCSRQCLRHFEPRVAQRPSPPAGFGTTRLRPLPTRSDEKAEAVAVTLLLGLPKLTWGASRVADPKASCSAEGEEADGEECSLCLENYEDGQLVRRPSLPHML